MRLYENLFLYQIKIGLKNGLIYEWVDTKEVGVEEEEVFCLKTIGKEIYYIYMKIEKEIKFLKTADGMYSNGKGASLLGYYYLMEYLERYFI